jgi:hypothetical protein
MNQTWTNSPIRRFLRMYMHRLETRSRSFIARRTFHLLQPCELVAITRRVKITMELARKQMALDQGRLAGGSGLT